MYKKVILVMALAVLLLGACQSPPSPTIEAPTAEIIRAGVTVDTTWIIPNIDACQKDLPGLVLSVRELTTSKLDSSQMDLLILTGSPELGTVSAVQIGQIQVIFIVHPSNPLQSLTDDELKNIFNRQMRQWIELDPALPAEEIEVWLPASGTEIRATLDQSIFTEQFPSRTANLAPDPEAMLAAVAANANAIGVLPSSFLNQTVKAVEIQSKIELPVLAVTKTEPSGLMHEFLLCLQTAILH